VGVDISEVMIENARRITEAVGAPARWICCDVLDTPRDLDGTADLVYTGRGALNWIHDLDAWAAVVARVLKPEGLFSVFETHPVAWLFDERAPDLRVMPGVNYFGVAWESQGWPNAYIGELEKPDARQAVKYDRLWNLADVFGALRGAGLWVEHLGEHAESYWDAFPALEQRHRGLFPQTFSMLARRASP
jgi:SAM-dependent methyltransferase